VASQVSCEAKGSIPTRFELERIRNEIANLDHDVNRMIRPVAEYKVQIDRMRKDVERTQANVDEQRKVLLGMTEDLRNNPMSVNYAGREYPADQVRHKLNKDFDSFKRLEANLKTQRKLLDAKENSLRASQDQLAKVITKKRDYELRLAQLEAEEETLNVARIGNSRLKLDDSRATQIDAGLAEIEKRHDVERAQIELEASGALTDHIPVHQRGPVDLQTIRNHLQNPIPAAPEAPETVSNK
jgi:peptidoglycan hydrolase CwlO-like protein